MAKGSQEAEAGSSPARCNGFGCPICYLVAATICFLWGGWAAHLYQRFTPIFTDIVCTMGGGKLKNMHLGTPLMTPTTFTLLVETKCDNPNPYTIGFAFSRKGEVSIGEDRMRVGHAMQAPFSDSGLPANNNGSVWAEAQVEISGSMLSELLPMMLNSDGIPMFLELNNQLEISINFFFGSWSMKKWMHKKCGLRISSLMNAMDNTDPMGPMACADTWDDLHVPSLTSTHKTAMVMSASNMAPDDIKKGIAAKNWGLGITMGVMFGLGTLFFARALCLWPGIRKRRRKGSGREMINTVSDAEDTDSD